MIIFKENKLFKRIENQPFTQIDDEIVMLNLENNEYYGLNKTATKIWNLLKEPITIGNIVENLLHEYEIDKETCEVEVKNFLMELLEKKLLVEVN